MSFTFKDRKGNNSSKYVERLLGKRCSSNSFHVLKVKENKLFKEQKTVVREKTEVPVCQESNLFSQKQNKTKQNTHYLTVTFSYWNSLEYFVIGIQKGSLQEFLY